MSNQAQQVRAGRHTGSALLVLGETFGRTDHGITHSVEEEQESLTLRGYRVPTGILTHAE